MMRIFTPQQFHEVPGSAGFDPACLAAERASAHILMEDARCSVWWEGTPVGKEGRCGAIGHFHAQEPAAAEAVLGAACSLLQEQGCAQALAPMNGNTWRSYRYATGGSLRPPFLMEPPPAHGRDVFLEKVGFAPVHRYCSYQEPLAEWLEQPDPLLSLEAAGFRVRPLKLSRLEEELHRVYALAALAFRENPFYTDLPRDAFVAQYSAYRDLLVPDLILLAFHGGHLAGFLFCLPDYAEQQGQPTTLLLKTLAVAQPHRRAGLGGGLMALAKRRAAQKGFTQGIGALVYQGNLSERLCRWGEMLREYTLYGRPL